jgi:HSP90 family molecular chaperone
MTNTTDSGFSTTASMNDFEAAVGMNAANNNTTGNTKAKEDNTMTNKATTTKSKPMVKVALADFNELLDKVRVLTAAQSTPKATAAKPSKGKATTATATATTNKTKAKQDRKAAMIVRGSDATARIQAATGLDAETVSDYFKQAHAYAAPSNAQGPAAYKAAYDTKLNELCGCARYSVAA